MKFGNSFHSAGLASANARFSNFLSDHATRKSASDEDVQLFSNCPGCDFDRSISYFLPFDLELVWIGEMNKV